MTGVRHWRTDAATESALCTLLRLTPAAASRVCASDAAAAAACVSRVPSPQGRPKECPGPAAAAAAAAARHRPPPPAARRPSHTSCRAAAGVGSRQVGPGGGPGGAKWRLPQATGTVHCDRSGDLGDRRCRLGGFRWCVLADTGVGAVVCPGLTCYDVVMVAPSFPLLSFLIGVLGCVILSVCHLSFRSDVDCVK